MEICVKIGNGFYLLFLQKSTIVVVYLDSITLLLNPWKFQKIHEQLLLKAMEKLEVLSETIQEYCNAVSVSSRTLFR